MEGKGSTRKSQNEVVNNAERPITIGLSQLPNVHYQISPGNSPKKGEARGASEKLA